MKNDKIIKDLMRKMLEAMQAEAGNGWKDISKISKEFNDAKAERLELIMELKLNGELDNEAFKQRLSHERKMTSAEIDAMEVMAKGAVQRAVNAAFEVFEKTLLKLTGL